MKLKFFLFITLLISTATTAQINLVPNPSFEDTVYCPTGLRQVDACEHWLNFGNSPDYFNACSNPAFGVPNSVFGFQYAHTGNAYAGAVFYARSNIPAGPNYREFLGVELLSNLIIGQKYYVSFYVVNTCKYNVSIANNKLGLNFYTVPFDSCCPPPLLNTAKLYTDSIITDTLNWTKISGSFISDSAYQYLCISNFFNDAYTDTIELYQYFTHGYYYIDDVCVTTDSLFNETWTGIDQIYSKTEIISIFPNPSSGYFNIESPVPILRCEVFNMNGQLIAKADFTGNNSYFLDMLNRPRGMYILRIYSKYSTNNSKIILTD